MPRLFAYLSYQDAPAALRWLQALGFNEVRRQDGKPGQVQHAEVRLGEIVLMVASNDASYTKPPLVGRSTGQGLYLLVENVDEMHARAVDAGGHSVFAPEDPNGAPVAHECSTPKVANGASEATNPERPGNARTLDDHSAAPDQMGQARAGATPDRRDSWGRSVRRGRCRATEPMLFRRPQPARSRGE